MYSTCMYLQFICFGTLLLEATVHLFTPELRVVIDDIECSLRRLLGFKHEHCFFLSFSKIRLSGSRLVAEPEVRHK